MLQTKSQSFRQALRGWLLKAPYRFPDESGQAGLRNVLLRIEVRKSYQG